MKWLVTAFAPFGGATSNSSLIVLNELRKRDWQDQVEFHAPVPVEFQKAWKNIREAIELRGQNGSEIGGVLALGQAESRARIGLERVALNWMDARIPDNAGFTPLQGSVQVSAPNMHWSNIPWENFELSQFSERSYSAGTYVCNRVMFESLDWALANEKKAGFVHIPVLSSQVEQVFDKFPRVDDQAAVQEVARILEFLLKL